MSALLERILARLGAAGRRGVCIFDLDGTVLDNRPRQARIVREFGARRGLPKLQSARADHWTTWSMKDAFRRMGVDDATVEAIYREARAWWEARFFTSEYCVEDRPVPGAPSFVRRVVESGAQIAYTTGRPEAMREGTLAVFGREGFPLPGDGSVHMFMKNDPKLHDDEFKVRVIDRLRDLGRVVAAFDNEPTHANTYRSAFPDALVVRIATEHSGRPVTLLAGIEELSTFR